MKKEIKNFIEENTFFGVLKVKDVKELLKIIAGQIRENTNVDIGAIPETNDYANGWNDCRKRNYKTIKKPLKKLADELENIEL